MDWAEIADDFVRGEGLRTIHILNPSRCGCRNVHRALQRFQPRPVLKKGDKILPLPSLPRSLRELRTRQYHLVLHFEGLRIHGHCFYRDVNFDIAPGDVTGPTELAAVVRFLTMLGEAACREIVLCTSFHLDMPILRYLPDTGQVEWVPPTPRRLMGRSGPASSMPRRS